jgi:hypothetical protein
MSATVNKVADTSPTPAPTSRVIPTTDLNAASIIEADNITDVSIFNKQNKGEYLKLIKLRAAHLTGSRYLKIDNSFLEKSVSFMSMHKNSLIRGWPVPFKSSAEGKTDLPSYSEKELEAICKGFFNGGIKLLSKEDLLQEARAEKEAHRQQSIQEELNRLALDQQQQQQHVEVQANGQEGTLSILDYINNALLRS